MTTPDEAKARAAEALERATVIKEHGDSIAARWRQSQEDNNFRQMLRRLSKGPIGNASS